MSSSRRKFRRTPPVLGARPGTVEYLRLSFPARTPLRHPPFDEEIRNDIRTLADALEGLFNRNWQEWEEYFRKETDFLPEIEWYLDVARQIEGKPLEEQKRIYLEALYADSGRQPIADAQ